MPKLNTCEEAIPAVVFGTYDFPLGSALQVFGSGMRFHVPLPLYHGSATKPILTASLPVNEPPRHLRRTS